MGELTIPLPLCQPDGRLNPDAVGWSRHPLHAANLRGWGRKKRWEYWCLVTPRFIVALTICSLDYVGVHSIYVLDRRTGVEVAHRALEPLARSVQLQGRSRHGLSRARAGGLSLEFAPSAAGTRLRASGPGIRLSAEVGGGQQRECLGVVVPWSSTRFQYTLKDVGRPAAGVLVLDGDEHRFGDDGSFAVLDHGRGRWPYSVTWNWAAGHGRVAGHDVGLQLGGK